MELEEFWGSSELAFSVLRPWESTEDWRRIPIKCLNASCMCEETRQPRRRVIDRISTVFQTFHTMVANAWQQQLLIGPKVSESGMVEGLDEVPVGFYRQVSPPGTTAQLSYNPQRSASRPLEIHFWPSWPIRQTFYSLSEQHCQVGINVQMQEPVGDVSHSNRTGMDSSWHLYRPEKVPVVPSQVEKPQNSHSIR